MGRPRLNTLAGRIVLAAVGVSLGTALIVYLFAVSIDGAAGGLGDVKREILVGGLIAAAIALQIPYRLMALRRPGRPLIAPRRRVLLSCGLVAALIANWLVDVVAGRAIPL